MMGSQEPSERIAPEYRATDGPDAVRILRAGGTVLDPWQSDILDDWMGRTVSGKWTAPTAGGSVPRQNGKSLLVQGRAASGMLMFSETVIYTAHLQKTATETFEEMRAFFEGPKMRRYVSEIRTALGREQIILKSGAKIKFLARTRNGGRGQHGDLLIFDEAQELDETAQGSFIPAISASLNPQTIYVGTPPGPDAVGTVFRALRKRALEGEAKKAAWFEFSVPEIGDVKDPARWAAANPALGRRIQYGTIEGESEQLDADTFARERLGWWSPVAAEHLDYALDRKAWAACASEEEKPEGKTAYGVKFAADGSAVCLCGAVIPKEGPARVSLIDLRPTGQGLAWLADWLCDRYGKASCVVIDGRNGVDVLDADKLKSRRMIGLDVMGETVEYTSCVSCFTSDLMKLTKTCETEPAKGAALMLTVSGVQPVHAGAMVHPEQFNAIKITARLLNALSENGAAYRLSTMAGGEAENYAPVETKTVILCNEPDTVKAILNGELEKIDRELQDGKQNLTLEIRDTAANGMLSDADTQAIVDLIYLMPSNTVAIRTAGEEMTATNNVGTVSLNGGAFELVMSDRAASRSFKNGVLGRVKRLAKLCGFTLETSLRYDSWEYQPNSYMRRMTADLMKEVYSHEMMETACPGGLECCSLLPRMEGLDIVMFAPIGENCHTTDEYMNLKSFDRVYDFLKTLLGRLK